MQSQQNSDPQTAQVMWLQDPSSILTMRTLHLGHTLSSDPPPGPPLTLSWWPEKVNEMLLDLIGCLCARAMSHV